MQEKCEQLCQKSCLFLFFSRQPILKPSLLICHLDNGNGTAALSPTEKGREESKAGLAVALDKRSLRLRPGPEAHLEKADTIHIFTSLASRLQVDQ